MDTKIDVSHVEAYVKVLASLNAAREIAMALGAENLYDEISKAMICTTDLIDQHLDSIISDE